MLAAILSFLNIWIPMDGVYAGVWVGIVFVGMTSLSTYLFEGRPIKLFLINYGYHVVALGIVGGFLAMWR